MQIKFTVATTFAAAVALSFVSSSAFAAQRTQGFGLALKTGTVNNLPAQGGEMSVRFGKVEFSAGAMVGKADWKDATEDNEDATVETNIDEAVLQQRSINATMKLHPMNGSFYFGLGGGASQLQGTLKAEGASGGNVDEKITIDRQLATLSVGNVWTPGGFMIGAEWIGFSSALGSKTKIESNSTSDDTEEARKFFADSAKLAGEKGALNMFVIHLGYMIGK